jgi:flagella basal body P-ring formation protein FlgA
MRPTNDRARIRHAVTRRAVVFALAGVVAYGGDSLASASSAVATNAAPTGGAVVRGSTRVELRSTLTILPDSPLRVRDLAELHGPESEALGEVVVRERARKESDGPWAVVSVDELREAIERAAASVGGGGADRRASALSMGRVLLRGSRCAVRFEGVEAPASAPRAQRLPKAEPDGVRLDGPATLRQQIALRLSELLGVSVDDLRLKISGTGGSDEGELDTALSASRRVEVRPMASPASGRVPVQVDAYEQDRLVASMSYSVELRVRRGVLVVGSPIERDAAISGDVVSAEERWVSPSDALSPALDELAGMRSKRRLSAGQVLTRADVQMPMAAERGELVWVHYLSGRLALKAKGRALTTARDGEQVQVLLDGSKRPITARMSGRGVAVVRADDATSGQGAAPGVDAIAPASVPASSPAQRAQTSAGAARPAARPAAPVRIERGPSGSHATGGPSTVRERARLWTPTSTRDLQAPGNPSTPAGIGPTSGDSSADTSSDARPAAPSSGVRP